MSGENRHGKETVREPGDFPALLPGLEAFETALHQTKSRPRFIRGGHYSEISVLPPVVELTEVAHYG